MSERERAMMGWAVEIERKNGTRFLSSGLEGVLPVVFPSRKRARQWRRELIECFDRRRVRVVRVEYRQPRVVERERARESGNAE